MSSHDYVVGHPDGVASGWTVAIVSEGYTRAELDAGLFDKDAAAVAVRLLNTPPFSHRDLRRQLVVVKAPIASANTGNTIVPKDPVPAVSPFGTAFGAMFNRSRGSDGHVIERAVHGDNTAVKAFVRSRPGLAAVTHFLVIVNNSLTDGGLMSEGVGWFTKVGSLWPAIAVHELAHEAFDLADEYQYQNDEDSDPLTTFRPRPADLDVPNATTATAIPEIKWSEFITLPQNLVPTTVTGGPCVRRHPAIVTPAGTVGAYEGTAHFDCGIFRPSLTCLMRRSTAPFCGVCENTGRAVLGHYVLKQGGGISTTAGLWTHVQTFPDDPGTGVLSYHVGAGTYAVTFTNMYLLSDRRPDGSPPIDVLNPSQGAGSIGPGWTWLSPFQLNGVPHFLGHQGDTGRQAVFRLKLPGNFLQKAVETPPGQASHTHVVTLDIGGAPHYLGYNSFTGDAQLFRLVAADAAPSPVVTMQWGAGHNVVTAVPLDGIPLVLTYRIDTGEVALRAITPSGFTMAFSRGPNFWTRDITHAAAFVLAGRCYVLRYSALTGRASIHYVHRQGDGIDPVCAVLPAPGPGGHSIQGVGMPMMGPFPIAGLTRDYDNLYFYSTQNRTLRAVVLTPG
ncbi:M64 family metallopeptidase [Kitasatospora sp. NPDC098652]|uniref:M64 family metallopeptidase n=1 Tax=Kitasatospora sp. NPDC098652 TaxID=3364095 RepID=UPI0037F8A350